jgi:hypothetical protein
VEVPKEGTGFDLSKSRNSTYLAAIAASVLDLARSSPNASRGIAARAPGTPWEGG